MDFSIDMLRLKVKSTSEDLQRFFQGCLNAGASCDYYQSFNVKEFRHNFSFKETADINPFNNQPVNNKFWVGFDHNSVNNKAFTYLYIEFNPNKCDVTFGYLNLILRTFFTSFTSVYICSADFCVDFPDVSVDSFFYDRCLKRYTCDIRSQQGKTIYIGSPGSNGRIKIYDKAAERGLKDTLLTRYEVSLKFDDLLMKNILLEEFDFDFNVPDVYFFDKLDLSDIVDINVRSFIFSVICGFTKIDDYSRKTRQKIKQTLQTSASFKHINKNNKKLITDTIITYFRNFINTFDIEFDKYFYAEKDMKPSMVVTSDLIKQSEKTIEEFKKQCDEEKKITENRYKKLDELEKRYQDDCKKLASYDELMSALRMGEYS